MALRAVATLALPGTSMWSRRAKAGPARRSRQKCAAICFMGEAVLVDDHGETPMRPGDIAAFPKNDGNGHVLQNRSDAPCTFVAIGRPADTACHYPDIDMHLFAGAGEQRRKDGSGF